MMCAKKENPNDLMTRQQKILCYLCNMMDGKEIPTPVLVFLLILLMEPEESVQIMHDRFQFDEDSANEGLENMRIDMHMATPTFHHTINTSYYLDFKMIAQLIRNYLLRHH